MILFNYVSKISGVSSSKISNLVNSPQYHAHWLGSALQLKTCMQLYFRYTSESIISISCYLDIILQIKQAQKTCEIAKRSESEAAPEWKLEPWSLGSQKQK